MSLRLEILQVARLAPQVLGESAQLVGNFLRARQADDGGFKDRTGQSDLYYTVFGAEGLLALGQEPDWDRLCLFLEGFGDRDELDLIHACCLARCWSAVPRRSAKVPSSIAARIESFRTENGGYHPKAGAPFGSVYGGFLAWGAYQDLGLALPDPPGLVQSLARLQTPDGAWANEPDLGSGSTNATSAAVTLLRNMGLPIRREVCPWIRARYHPSGGFVAAPTTPIPDLLSTATALHALAGQGDPISAFKEGCLDFIDSLWTNEGSFHGHWHEDTLDCEYTYYGLLALGHLSL